MKKTIIDYPNYEISSDGIVIAKETKRESLGRQCVYKSKIIKPQFLKNGYYAVHLYNEKGHKTFYVHRLVASHFLDNSNNEKTVNHKDGNKLNNHVNNLEWCSYSDNNKHAYKKNLNYFTEKQRISLKESGFVRGRAIKNKILDIYYLNYKCAAKELKISPSYVKKLITNSNHLEYINKV